MPKAILGHVLFEKHIVFTFVEGLKECRDIRRRVVDSTFFIMTLPLSAEASVTLPAVSCVRAGKVLKYQAVLQKVLRSNNSRPDFLYSTILLEAKKSKT